MEQIADWLKQLGMREYIQRFAENDIDFAILADLTDQDLEKIGVRSLGHRRKLLRAIAGIKDLEKSAPAVAVANTPPATPRSGDSAERRQVTVMFSDLVGSTALSARMDPEDLRELISAYQKCVAEAVGRFGGFVAQYLGDGVLVYFGYPEAHEDDAERAVRAGLELIAAVIALKTPVSLQTRVGIATGLVVVGDLIGSGEAQEGGIVGETPNLAARLQGIAEPNMVVIAESTRRLLGNLLELEDLGAKDLKGIGEPVRVWAALRAGTVESRFEALHASGLTALVGREEETELLLRRWSRAKSGKGQVVLISGEAGIGKSRLTRAVLEKFNTEPHTRLIYHCSTFHQDDALHPFIAQLTLAAGIERDETAETKLDKLTTLLRQTGDPIDEEVGLFAALLSIPGGDRFPLPRQTPRQMKERTLNALVAQLQRSCKCQPVLMVFEDLHWIDPTSLELLTRIVEEADCMQLLLLATTRTEFTAPWPNHRHIANVTLSRLDRADGQALVAGITRGKSLPIDVVNHIVARTDGVPLFIEELTKTVLESGLLREEADCYELTRPLPQLAIPSTLHASLLARLDRLAAVKGVAQIGAAIGRQFSYTLIAVVAALPEPELRAALSQLVSAELIFQRGVPPNATYLFKHALVQDAAYASLVRSRRSQLHALIAKELISRNKTGEHVNFAILGHHCSNANMIAEAVDYYERGAEQSVARSALSEAKELLDKSLSELARLPHNSERDRKELDLQCARGAVLMAVKSYAGVETGKTYNRAWELWTSLGRPPDFLSVPNGVWLFHLARAELQKAQGIADDLLEFGRTRADPGSLILGNHAVGVTLLHRGQLLSARSNLEEAVRLHDLADHSQLFQQAGTDPNVMGLAFLGLTLSWLGYPDQAFARIHEAIRRARRSAYVPTMAQCLAMSARLALILGDRARLVEWVKELAKLTEEQGYPSWSSQVLTYEGQLRLWRGEVEAAVTLLRQGVDAHHTSGTTLRTAFYVILLSEALEQDGKSGEALSLLDDQIAAVAKTSELWCAAELHRRRGELLLKRTVPDLLGAEAQYLQALDIARNQSAKLWELRAALNLAQLWRDNGRTIEARHLLSPILGWFTEGFDTTDLKNAKALLNNLTA